LKGILILIGIILVAAFFCGVLPAIQTNVLNIPAAALPVIQLPAERLSAQPLIDFPGVYSDIYLTNTLIATLIADLIIILLAIFATRKVKMIPTGLQNTMEALLDVLNDFTEQVAGPKHGRRIFPWMATIFIFLIVANWMELIPGVDSIGIMHHPEGSVKGHEVAAIGNSNILYLNVKPEARDGVSLDQLVAMGDGEDEAHAEEGHEACAPGDMCVVTPFVRAAATDLNLTLALALIAVVTVQVFGVQELGIGYFAKFFNTPALERGGMGYMDFVVGLLEIVSELAKVVSFAFRLFGNIFAGQVLLFVMSFLIPFMLPTVFYGLELFVGAIQAFVFAMLTLVFISMSMVGHHGDESEHH
jgi:F-type H+-transporting ATPase subunit a